MRRPPPRELLSSIAWRREPGPLLARLDTSSVSPGIGKTAAFPRSSRNKRLSTTRRQHCGKITRTFTVLTRMKTRTKLARRGATSRRSERSSELVLTHHIKHYLGIKCSSASKCLTNPSKYSSSKRCFIKGRDLLLRKRSCVIEAGKNVLTHQSDRLSEACLCCRRARTCARFDARESGWP